MVLNGEFPIGEVFVIPVVTPLYNKYNRGDGGLHMAECAFEIVRSGDLVFRIAAKFSSDCRVVLSCDQDGRELVVATLNEINE